MTASHELMLTVTENVDLVPFFGHPNFSPMEYAYHTMVADADLEATVVDISATKAIILVSQLLDKDMLQCRREQVAEIVIDVSDKMGIEMFNVYLVNLMEVATLFPASHYAHHLKGQYWSDKFEMWVSIPN